MLQAQASVKEKTRELDQRDKLITVLQTVREQCLATLHQHGIPLDKHLQVLTGLLVSVKCEISTPIADFYELMIIELSLSFSVISYPFLQFFKVNDNKYFVL